MKRQSFMIASGGALLAGCAAPVLTPSGLTNPETRSRSERPLTDNNAQMTGSIMLAPYSFTPKPYAACNGQLLKINQNLVLFSLLGTKFGGDGQKDFALPDLRGHEPIKGLAYYIATNGFYPVRKKFEPDTRWGIPPLLGQISCIAYLDKYVPPAGWAACDGQLKQIEKDIALYTLLGTAFGGDGKTTFGLPDLRGHELAKGLTYVIALTGRYPEGR